MATKPKESSDQSSQQRDKDDVRAGLDHLARRYYAPLASFFRKRTRDTADVQDLVQQVFLRLAQYREVDKIHNADGFIFQTASNTLKDHSRKSAVRDRYFKEQIELGGAFGSDLSPERVLLGKESVAQLADALRQLPERTRDVFMLRCFEGLKHSEIARLQGISVRAVERHVGRALAHLSSSVERET